MKAVVLYYSNGGYTMEMAEEIKASIAADIEKIIPAKDILADKNKNNISILAMKLFGDKPRILSLKSKIEEYDLIFIGTPVWFGSYTPFINTLLSKYIFKGKSVGIFCCCDMTGSATLDKLKKRLKGANILGSIEINTKDGTYINVGKIREWSQSLMGKQIRMD